MAVGDADEDSALVAAAAGGHREALLVLLSDARFRASGVFRSIGEQAVRAAARCERRPSPMFPSSAARACSPFATSGSVDSRSLGSWWKMAATQILKCVPCNVNGLQIIGPMLNVQLARRYLSRCQDDTAVGEQLLHLARHGWSPPTSSDLSRLWGRLPDQYKGAPLHVRFLLLRLAMVLGASASAGMEVGPPIELAIDMDDCLQSSFDELQRSLPCGRPVRLLSATGADAVPW